MPQGDKGTLGTIEFYLSQNPGLSNFERYRRQLIPVEPASRQIPGSPDAVAPDTTIAQWSINNWDQGEGDVTWRDRGRYNVSTRLSPASDGSGLIVVPLLSVTQHDSAGGNFDQGQAIARAGSELLTAKDGDDTLYKWDETNDEWDDYFTLGGSGTGNVGAIAAVNDTEVWVGIDATIRKVATAVNSTHFAAWGSNATNMVSYQGKIYVLEQLDMYELDLSSTDTRTLRGDVAGTIAGYFNADSRLLSTSDVGPIWTTQFNDGRSELWEYNVAQDEAYVVAQLPRDITIYDVLFHEGIYFVGYRGAAKTVLEGAAFVYFTSGGNRGSVGPFRAQSGVTAVKFVNLAGVIGDRLLIQYDNVLFAYDLSSGGISGSGTDGDSSGSVRKSTTYGNEVFLATFGSGGITRFDFALFAANGSLDTGRYDFGYKGLRKMMTKVTIVCEAALVASDVITVAVAVDGGSFTTLSGSMTAGDVTKTFIVATTSTNFEGFSFEIRAAITTGSSAASPKIISIDSEAIGVESRLEWIMAVDVTDNNKQQGQTVLTGLETLRTAKAPIAFTNPFDHDVYATADSHTVTIEDVTFPQENAGGDDYVVVRVRATQTV